MTRRDILGAMAGGALLSACSAPQRPRDAVRLKVALSVDSPTSAPLYLAEENGYFREAGLLVEVEPATNIATFVQLTAAGTVDLSLPALTPAMVNAVPRAAGVKAVFARERISGECGGAGQLVVRAESFPAGFPDARVLRGKRIGVINLGGAMDYLLHLMLASAGVRRDELEVLSMRPPESMAAVQAGRIDGFVSYGFIGAIPEAWQGRITYHHPLAATHPEQQASYIVFGPRLLGADRAIGVRFLRAWLQGTRDWIGGRTPRHLETWAQENGLDLSMVASPCRGNISPDGRIHAPSLQGYADWLRQTGVAEAPVRAADMMDASLLEEAAAA